MSKKAQIQIGFGFIFSIILIILFIAFAIYGIGKFLDVVRVGQIEQFKDDFQNDINKAITSSSTLKDKEYPLPRIIKQVCFTDSDIENMHFITDKEKIEGTYITGINMQKTLNGKEVFCIFTKGEIKMILRKDYNENTVTISCE